LLRGGNVAAEAEEEVEEVLVVEEEEEEEEEEAGTEERDEDKKDEPLPLRLSEEPDDALELGANTAAMMSPAPPGSFEGSFAVLAGRLRDDDDDAS
jgi:hypothetical protein